jgi:hypothetical protein
MSNSDEDRPEGSSLAIAQSEVLADPGKYAEMNPLLYSFPNVPLNDYALPLAPFRRKENLDLGLIMAREVWVLTREVSQSTGVTKEGIIEVSETGPPLSSRAEPISSERKSAGYSTAPFRRATASSTGGPS